MVLLGEKVHGTTPPLAAACFLAEQLTHHFPRWNTSAQGVHVVSIGAAKPIVLALHGADHPCAHGLLAVVKVNEAKHLAAVVHLRALVLEATAEGHVAEQLQTRLPVHRGPLGCDEVGQAFGVGTSGCAADGGGVDRKVLTHDRPNQWG